MASRAARAALTAPRARAPRRALQKAPEPARRRHPHDLARTMSALRPRRPVATSVSPLADMVVPPTALPLFSAAASRAQPAAWTLALRPAARSLDELLGEPGTPHRARREEAQQEQGMVAFDLKDKMGLFLSVCSVLVSIHMLTPRVM